MPFGKLPQKKGWHNLSGFREALGQIAEKGKLPAVPKAVNWTRSIQGTDWKMLGNKQHGDCTVAAAGHMMMCWSDNTCAAPWTIEEADILEDYDDYRTSPSGSTIENILYCWQQYGLHRRDLDGKAPVRIDGFAPLDINHPANLRLQAQRSIQLLGGCCIGLWLPKFATAAAPPGGDPPPPPNWDQTHAELTAMGPDGDKNPAGAHCVPAIGFNADGLLVITWSQAVQMSWDFFLRYSNEAWAVLCKDAWLIDGKKTPSGLTAQQLTDDFGEIGQ